MQSEDHASICSLPAAQRDARVREYRQELLAKATARREIDDGFVFEFAFMPETLEQLCTFVKNETACCTSLTYTLLAGPTDGKLSLTLQGGEEAREMIRAFAF